MKAISSINGMVKAGVFSTMLTGAATLYASNPITKDAQPNQTEVVSKDGANALKAASMAEIEQASYPTEHNIKLDETLRKYIQNDEDRKYINNILNNAYKKYGTYLGSAIVQHEIDFQQFCTFVNKNSDILIKKNINKSLGNSVKKIGPELFKTLEGKEPIIKAWANIIYNQKLDQQLEFDKIPSAIEVIDRLDNMVEHSDFLTNKDKKEYYHYCIEYMQRKGVAKNVREKSDVIARKMYLLDRIIYERLLKKLNVFSKDQYRNDRAVMNDYFISWIHSVEPDTLY